jgi:hypothetical protein
MCLFLSYLDATISQPMKTYSILEIQEIAEQVNHDTGNYDHAPFLVCSKCGWNEKFTAGESKAIDNAINTTGKIIRCDCGNTLIFWQSNPVARFAPVPVASGVKTFWTRKATRSLNKKRRPSNAQRNGRSITCPIIMLRTQKPLMSFWERIKQR